jgi:polyphosphate kinase 2
MPSKKTAVAKVGAKDDKKGDKKGDKNGPHLGRKEYEEQLAPLHLELDRVARWVQHHGKRLVVLIEGRDTAGKGGVISAISHPLNPRQCQVVALSKPSEDERTQWYFQRYVSHLPAGGHIALFDRSWYNRAGVERVMGFCSDADVKRFLAQVPLFEKLLVDDGILLFKYWLTVDQAEQEQRFAERRDDPLKRWKLSPIDLQAREKYEDYGKARDAMLRATHTEHAPWTLVDFNDQRRGRLTLIRHLLDQLPDCDVPEQTVEFPPLSGKPRKEVFRGPLRPIPGMA